MGSKPTEVWQDLADPTTTRPSSVSPPSSPEDLGSPGPSTGDVDRVASMLRHAGTRKLTNRCSPSNGSFPPYQGLHSPNQNRQAEKQHQNPGPTATITVAQRVIRGWSMWNRGGENWRGSHNNTLTTVWDSRLQEMRETAGGPSGYLFIYCMHFGTESYLRHCADRRRVRASHTPLPAAESRPRLTALPTH